MPTESDKNAFSLESGNLWSAFTHPIMSNAENVKEAAKKTGKEVAKEGEDALGGLGGWLQGMLGGLSKEGGFLGFLFSIFVKPIMNMLGLGGSEETAQAPQTPQTPTTPDTPAQSQGQGQDLASTAISAGINKTLDSLGSSLDFSLPESMRNSIVQNGTQNISTALSELTAPATPKVQGQAPQVKIPS